MRPSHFCAACFGEHLRPGLLIEKHFAYEATRRNRALAVLILWCGSALASTAAPQLAGVIFEGASHYSPEALLPLYRAELGRPLDDALQQRIASGLVAMYDADGFLRPVVELESRHSEAGVLVFNVREPAVRQVAVAGQEFVSDTQFWQQLADLQRETPLSKQSFHDWLARVNRADDMLVTGTIAPLGGAAADYAAQLQVAARPLTGMVHVDNQAPQVARLRNRAGRRVVSVRGRSRRTTHRRRRGGGERRPARVRVDRGHARLRRRGHRIRVVGIGIEVETAERHTRPT